MQREKWMSTCAQRARASGGGAVNILTASRLNSLSRSHDAADLERALEIQAGIAGLTAAELNFPQHVTNPDDGRLIQRARSLGLAVTALNLGSTRGSSAGAHSAIPMAMSESGQFR